VKKTNKIGYLDNVFGALEVAIARLEKRGSIEKCRGRWYRLIKGTIHDLPEAALRGVNEIRHVGGRVELKFMRRRGTRKSNTRGPLAPSSSSKH
jgi:hypothetical protein